MLNAKYVQSAIIKQLSKLALYLRKFQRAEFEFPYKTLWSEMGETYAMYPPLQPVGMWSCCV